MEPLILDVEPDTSGHRQLRAGLAILDTLAASSRLARWPQLHIARAALLTRCDRLEDAVAAYRDALALEAADAVRRHITGPIAALGAAPAPTQEM